MAGWIAAGASILGDIMSSQGSSQTNAMSANEANLNRQFQANETNQIETWEQQNSDTAMQRRVQDLNAAGLNPLLAVSQGGASQPSVSPPGGAMPQFTNPNASFASLGGQISNAQALQSQVDLQTAQAKQATAGAKKTESETPTPAVTGGEMQPDGTMSPLSNNFHGLGDATVANIQAQTNLTNAQQGQVASNVKLIQSNTDLNNVKTAIEDQNRDILIATKQALIQEQNAEGNKSDVMTGKFGQAITVINAILHPMSSAAGISRQIQ